MASLFGNDPGDPSILSIISATLRDAGAGYGGRQSDVLGQLMAQQRQSKIYQQLQQSVLGTPNAPGLPGVNITPNQMTGQGGGVNIPSVAPGGLQGGALSGLPQGGQIAQMLSGLSPDVSGPILQQIFGQMVTKDLVPQPAQIVPKGAAAIGPGGTELYKNEEPKVKYLSPQEFAAASGGQSPPPGWLPYQKEDGTIDFTKSTDLESPGRVQQQEQVRRAGMQPVAPTAIYDPNSPTGTRFTDRTGAIGQPGPMTANSINALAGAPGSAPLGITNSPEIDPTVPGYSNAVVGNTGITQAAIDQRALGHITAGTSPPIGRTGVAGLQNAAVSNRMAEMDPGGNLAAHKTEIKAFGQSLASQQKYLDNTQRALNTANDTLDSLQSYMETNGINPSQFPDINRFTNYLKAKGIDPGAAGGYTAQLATLRAEYSQVLAKGGVRSVETDREAAKLIPDGLPPAALAKVADQIKIDADNVVRDAQQQVTKINGQINNIRKGGTTGAQAPSAPTSQPRLKYNPATGRVE